MQLILKPKNKLLRRLFLKLNKTPYDGYLIFKFELMPYRVYDKTQLNKVYFNILAYKFVSRIKWNDQYIPERIKAIEEDGMMQFGYAVLNHYGMPISRQVGVNIEKIRSINALPNYKAGVFNKDEEYVGDILFAWRMVSMGLVADKRYPGIFFKPAAKAYNAYTGNIAASFAIKDKIFDPEWVPTEETAKWEWIMKYCKAKHIPTPGTVADFLKYAAYADLKTVVPFNQQGDKEISTLGEARLAARNFKSYMERIFN